MGRKSNDLKDVVADADAARWVLRRTKSIGGGWQNFDEWKVRPTLEDVMARCELEGLGKYQLVSYKGDSVWSMGATFDVASEEAAFGVMGQGKGPGDSGTPSAAFLALTKMHEADMQFARTVTQEYRAMFVAKDREHQKTQRKLMSALVELAEDTSPWTALADGVTDLLKVPGMLPMLKGAAGGDAKAAVGRTLRGMLAGKKK